MFIGPDHSTCQIPHPPLEKVFPVLCLCNPASCYLSHIPSVFASSKTTLHQESCHCCHCTDPSEDNSPAKAPPQGAVTTTTTPPTSAVKSGRGAQREWVRNELKLPSPNDTTSNPAAGGKQQPIIPAPAIISLPTDNSLRTPTTSTDQGDQQPRGNAAAAVVDPGLAAVAASLRGTIAARDAAQQSAQAGAGGSPLQLRPPYAMQNGGEPYGTAGPQDRTTAPALVPRRETFRVPIQETPGKANMLCGSVGISQEF